MEEILKAISTIGFPIVVAVYILVRIEPRLNKLTEIINKLIPILENIKGIENAINNLRIEIARMNGRK